MSTHYVLLLAGGTGSRIGGALPKQFVPVRGKAVLLWSVELFSSMESVAEIIITSPRDFIAMTDATVEPFRKIKPIRVIEGGATRQDSSWRAVAACGGAPGDILIIHDAARPFVSLEAVSEAVVAAQSIGGAALYVPAVDTVAIGDDRGMISSVPDRTNLYYAQTPQVFRYEVMYQSHLKAREEKISSLSDDVSLALHYGYRVARIQGDYGNFKITTSEDISRAEAPGTGQQP